MNNAPRHPDIRILGRAEAAMLLQQPLHQVVAVVSIHAYGEFPLETTGIERVLSLNFDDAEVLDPADPQSRHRAWTREQWARGVGRAVIPPTIDHARAIIEFADATKGVDGVVLFQCQGGISRSSAAALICPAAWTGEGHELYCVDELMRVRSSASPHRGLVAFGDQLLSRQGRLTEALLKRPR